MRANAIKNQSTAKWKMVTVKNLFVKNYTGWLFLLPTIFLFFIILWKPIFQGVYLSFFDLQGYTPVKFIGFSNYKDVLKDIVFLKALTNTLKYVGWSLVIGFIPPILFAVIINEFVHLKSFFRFTLYFPVMVPSVATAIMWGFLYQPGENGILNLFLSKLGIPASSMLLNQNLTIPLIVFSMTWRGLGSSFLMYLASLQDVNQDLYEAATIDGAGIFQKIKNITMPHISGIMLLLLMRQIISVFQVMVEPMTMTDGGPANASLTLCLQSYYYAFRYYQPDKAIALGVVIFILLIGVSIFYMKFKNRDDS